MGEQMFVPLCREPFDAFWSGAKTVEIRKHGRTWNEKTVRDGRPVLLRCGYSGDREIYGTVRDVVTASSVSELPADVRAAACLAQSHRHYYEADLPVIAFRVSGAVQRHRTRKARSTT